MGGENAPLGLGSPLLFFAPFHGEQENQRALRHDEEREAERNDEVHPAAFAFVSYGIALVRVRVRVREKQKGTMKRGFINTAMMRHIKKPGTGALAPADKSIK